MPKENNPTSPTVTLNAIILGALGNWTLNSNTAYTPAELLSEYAAFIEAAKALDKDCKFQESFPSYGKGGNFGNKELITKRVVAINGNFSKSPPFISLTCEDESGEESFTVSLSKEKAGSFVSDITALTSEKIIESLNKAVKSSTTNFSKVLKSNEQFNCSFAKSKDGNTNWADSFATAGKKEGVKDE